MGEIALRNAGALAVPTTQDLEALASKGSTRRELQEHVPFIVAAVVSPRELVDSVRNGTGQWQMIQGKANAASAL
jgi:hypothetical protein